MIKTDNPPVAPDAIPAQPAPPSPPDPASPPFTQARNAEPGRGITKIVVAIHGIGQQYRSETIRSVARRFGDSCKPAIPLLPLGYFNIAAGSDVRWSQLETDHDDLKTIGFAEVFWADIPNQLVRSNDTLEETKAWLRTVISRAECVYDRNVLHPRKKPGQATDAGPAPDADAGETPAEDADRRSEPLAECDFRQGIEAVETLAEGVAVIERLSQFAAKASTFKFEVGTLLRDYVGDVQTVTEFPQYRNKILYRFHAALNAIVSTFQARYGIAPEIYLVAHSEGTVISLLALLQGLSSMALADPDGQGEPEGGAWVEHMHGFMTLGSPIDKHIALWPELWEPFSFVKPVKAEGRVQICSTRLDAQPVRLRQHIKWRNYYDFGDPVGFRLDEARRWLASRHCGAFEFDGARHDHGYSRYWLPGKAHVDYWNDAELFQHFIDSVVKTPRLDTPPPAHNPWRGHVATSLPYLLAFALHLAAVTALFAALGRGPVLELSTLFGIGVQALVPSILLASVTVAARLPRLVRPEPRWRVLALVAWGIGALATWLLLPAGVAENVGKAWQNLAAAASSASASSASAAPGSAAIVIVGKATLCAIALLAPLAAWFVPRKFAPKGRRLLVASGFLLILGIVLLGRGGVAQVKVTEVVACLPFVFLWWLGIIVFDLAFVWHRYIRDAVSVRMLRAWRTGKNAKRDKLWGLVSGKD